MAITFTESFLYLTMSYNGHDGCKGYSGITGAVHSVDVSSTSLKRNIEKQGVSSYSQTVVPVSITYGKQPETLTMEGKLCVVDSSGNSVANYLSQFSNHVVNTLYNVFIPCSIVLTTSSTSPEINGMYWMVDTFKIKRNMQRRDATMFDLVLQRWYGDVPS